MKSTNNILKWIWVMGLIGLTASCVTNNSYQKQVGINGASWNSSNMPEFEFDIADTNTLYQSQLLLRHDDTYQFSNIWLKVYVQKPGDSTYTDSFQREILLADNEGYWLGEEQGNMWVHRNIIDQSSKLSRFKKPGTYKVKLQHLMRENPLPAVLNVGWRIDKISQ